MANNNGIVHEDINAVQIVDANDHNYNRVEDEIAVPEHLIDHNYYIPIVVQDNSASEDEFDEVLIADDMLSDEDDEDQPAIEIQRPDTYKKVPGVHNKSDVYIDNLYYKYYKKSVYRNKMYLVCEKQRNKKADDYCPAKATIILDDANNHIKLQHEGHNHLPVQQDLEAPFLRRDIGRRVIGLVSDIAVPTRQLYNEEIIYHPRGSFSYTFQQARERCKKMKILRRPPTPQTIEELVELLDLDANVAYRTTIQEEPSQLFQQSITVQNNVVGIIFANLNFIQAFEEQFQNVTIAGCEGTFKTVPSMPKQLRQGTFMTFQVIYKNVSFPLVYALLSSATEETYIEFFRVVRTMLPLNYDQLTIITDYERALMNAHHVVFPESRLQCCWFHYTQAVVRYCRRKYNSVYNLMTTNPIAARVLRMVLALPHLPAMRGQENCPEFSMVDGYQRILEYAQEFPEIYHQMETFLKGYIYNFWMVQVGPHFISVFGCDIRTNNYLESFHNQLKRFFGTHPNIWDFLQKLRILENQYYVEMIQASKDLKVRDQLTIANRAANTLILRIAIEQLNEDGDILRCLRKMGHANANYIRRQMGPRPLQ